LSVCPLANADALDKLEVALGVPPAKLHYSNERILVWTFKIPVSPVQVCFVPSTYWRMLQISLRRDTRGCAAEVSMPPRCDP
jgi:hypothetical protein